MHSFYLYINKMSKLLLTFLTFQTQLRMYHWSTKKYNRHIESGNLYEKIDTLIDQFMETLQGKLGPVTYKKAMLKLRSTSDSAIIGDMNKFKIFLNRDIELYLNRFSHMNNDLQNIRDEMLGAVNRSLYLFTLH